MGFVLLAAIAQILLVAGVGWAQVDAAADSLPPDSLRYETWYVNPYVGGFLVSDSEADIPEVGMKVDSAIIFGGRVGYRFADHWLFEGSYGYGSLSADVTSPAPAQETGGDVSSVDGQLHVYRGGVTYLTHAASNNHLLLSASLGGMRYSYDSFERRGVQLVDTSWANELITSFGIGVMLGNENVAFRADFVEHIQFCSAEELIDEPEDFSHCPLDDTVLGNPEFSAGIVLWFGGDDDDEYDEYEVEGR